MENDDGDFKSENKKLLNNNIEYEIIEETQRKDFNLNDLAEEFDGKAKVGKLDVDVNQQTAIKYGVRSIPTVLIIKGGEVKETIIGALPKTAFVEKLQSTL